jgi:archaellum component FlaG (FlaF/FlaG flagellin family)
MKKVLSFAFAVATLIVAAFVAGALFRAMWELFNLGWNLVP